MATLKSRKGRNKPNRQWLLCFDALDEGVKLQMNLLPLQKVILTSPLKKDFIKDILTNSINESGLESEVNFISGFVRNDSFKICTRQKIRVLRITSFDLTLEGKMVENREGCQVDLIIRYSAIINIWILFLLACSTFLFLSYFFGVCPTFVAANPGGRFSFLIPLGLVILIIFDYNNRAKLNKKVFIDLLKADR